MDASLRQQISRFLREAGHTDLQVEWLCELHGLLLQHVKQIDALELARAIVKQPHMFGLNQKRLSENLKRRAKFREHCQSVGEELPSSPAHLHQAMRRISTQSTIIA